MVAASPRRSGCPAGGRIPRVVALGFALAAGCAPGTGSRPVPAPEAADDGWPTLPPEEAGVDPAPLARLVARIDAASEPRIHGVLVAVGGRLVFERYWPGHPFFFDEGLREDQTVDFDRRTPHGLASVTKSVTATLLGIALQQGIVASPDVPVLDFFPELASLREGRDGITLAHLLTMTAGLEWDEWTHPIGDPRNDLIRLIRDPGDPVAFVLGRAPVAPPGERFAYSGGNFNVLGEAIGRASGERLDRFARERLFDPLGVGPASWAMLREGFVYASGDLRLTPRDALKLGQLYLQDGVWEGARLLPEGWVAAAATPASGFRSTRERDQSSGYGWGWWVERDRYGPGAFAAHGWGGTVIAVLPEYGALAMVTAAAQHAPAALSSHAIVMEHVLPALRPLRGPPAREGARRGPAAGTARASGG